MKFRSLIKIVVIVSLCLQPLLATDYQKLVQSYYSNNVVKEALNQVEIIKPSLILSWKEIARIYSPSGNEIKRAEYLVEKFRSYGIKNSYIDRHGNAVAEIKGSSQGPAIAFLGTMDDLKTVAQMVKEWDKPIFEKDDKLIGPGTNIGATCVSILGLGKLFTSKKLKFSGKIYLVGVVEEETGLTGIKGFLSDHPQKIDYVVDIMAGIGGISYGAIGIHWFKIHFKGKKGHTLGGGLPNVSRGVAKAVDRIFSIKVPKSPPLKKSFLNIAMLGAGKVFNHKFDDGWFSVDLRSMDNDILLALKQKIFDISRQVAVEEKLDWYEEKVSEVPAGQLPDGKNSKLVQVAYELVKIIGGKASLSNMGSSNMNVSISQGISSITMGGNRGGGRDSLQEYANITPTIQGIKANFLIGYILLSGQI